MAEAFAIAHYEQTWDEVLPWRDEPHLSALSVNRLSNIPFTAAGTCFALQRPEVRR